MKLLLTLVLALTACSSVPAPVSTTQTIFTLTPANCPQVRVKFGDGTYSTFWGGAGGLVIPKNGLSIQAHQKQIECRFNGVFGPLVL